MPSPKWFFSISSGLVSDYTLLFTGTRPSIIVIVVVRIKRPVSAHQFGPNSTGMSGISVSHIIRGVNIGVVNEARYPGFFQ